MSKAETKESNQDPRPQWGVILSAVFFISLLAVGMVVWNNSKDSSEQEGNTPQVQVEVDGRKSTVDELGRPVYIPGTAGGDVKEKTAGSGDPNIAPDVEWQRVHEQTSVAMPRDYPFSAQAGPWQVEEGFAREFAQTPQGAALASAHAFLNMTVGGDTGARAARYYFFANDPAAKQTLEDMISGKNKQKLPELAWNSSIAAYKVHSFSEEEAVVGLALKSGAQFREAKVKVTWHEGDWKFADESAASGNARIIPEQELATWVKI